MPGPAVGDSYVEAARSVDLSPETQKWTPEMGPLG